MCDISKKEVQTMTKRVRILVAPTCVSVMLSAVVPVFAKNDQETLDVQSAI